MVNKVTFIGRLTRDAETKEFNNTSVTNFALALDEGYKGKDGNWVSKTTFVECQIWNGSGKNLAERCSKGDLVYVEGKYEPNNWEDAEGVKKISPRFTIYTWKSLTFGKSKAEASSETEEKPAKPKKGRPAKSEKKPEVTETSFDDEDDIESDIPF